MLAVARCIAVEHDLAMIALALLVCALGTAVVIQMFERARASKAMTCMGWIFLTAVTAGATVWCTHFIAMLGYKVNVAVRIDPVLTVASLMVVVAGTSIGLWVALARAATRLAAAGGALVGVAAVIREVLALGKSMAIPVLAEGIETRRQLDILRREGWEEAQGYLLGYPVPLGSLLAGDVVKPEPAARNTAFSTMRATVAE